MFNSADDIKEETVNHWFYGARDDLQNPNQASNGLNDYF